MQNEVEKKKKKSPEHFHTNKAMLKKTTLMHQRRRWWRHAVSGIIKWTGSFKIEAFSKCQKFHGKRKQSAPRWKIYHRLPLHVWMSRLLPTFQHSHRSINVTEGAKATVGWVANRAPRNYRTVLFLTAEPIRGWNVTDVKHACFALVLS